MQILDFSETVARIHAPMVQRTAAIFAALGCVTGVVLRDIAESIDPTAAPCVTLERLALAGGATPALRNLGAGHWHLAYGDPGSDAAQGALLAAIARAGQDAGHAPLPIAADPESLSVIALADRLAVSEIPVLIGGPTGTGKEVLSRFIHTRSPRVNGPFVAVNCAAMPEAMLEAMLFGHVKGAFTGATSASEGFFRAADGGTLLLDEIAEMPLALQAKLLRALQEGEVVPIGATKPIAIDVRVIAAANRDLPTEVAEGRFRADLFYRLNVFPLTLPPLRARPRDIAPLAFAMVLRHGTRADAMDRPLAWIGDDALALLEGHAWPGNVRELENVIRRALLLAETTPATPNAAPVITARHIRFDIALRAVADISTAPMQDAAVQPLGEPHTDHLLHGRRLAGIVRQSEAEAIGQALSACGGSRIDAARRLGISERTLRYRLAAFREAGIAIDLTRSHASPMARWAAAR